MGDRATAAEAVDKGNTIEGALATPVIQDALFRAWSRGRTGSGDPALDRKEFDAWLTNEFQAKALSDPRVLSGISGIGAYDSRANYDWITLWGRQVSGINTERDNREAQKYARDYVTDYVSQVPNTYGYIPQNNRMGVPTSAYGGYTMDLNPLFTVLNEVLAESRKTGTFNPDDFAGGMSGGDSGGALSGYNRDRRNLEIHFHAPIVEWSSTIEATNPQDTVNVIAQDLEQITSAGLQKALLGASNKMSSRWY
jgi:hypothetical protein